MIYCFWLLLTVPCFWVVRMDLIVELFDGLSRPGGGPSIYPGWLRVGFTFLVPLAFAVTVPAQALTQQLGPVTVLAAAALAALLVVLTRLLWRVGLRHYSGASA